jgi:hypothetical protein
MAANWSGDVFGHAKYLLWLCLVQLMSGSLEVLGPHVVHAFGR